MNALYILDDSPWFEWIRLRSTDSTNHFLRHYRPVSPKDMVLATADYQTAGRGQAGNSWEAEEGKNLLFILFLTQMMITPQSTIYPNYLLVSKLHLLDTKMGMMCPYVASAMGVFLVRQAFMSIPTALEDAGKLDGCNTLQLIWNVFIPQIKTSLLAFSVISVTYHWNEFLWPLLVTETEKSRPLTVGLTVFAQQAEGGAEWGLLMAATLIVSLPLLIAFTLFQKMFVQAFLSSGLKG